jgi:hypothetical protein
MYGGEEKRMKGFMGNPEGKTSFGGPRRALARNVKMGLK